jgi:hypothetical protein
MNFTTLIPIVAIAIGVPGIVTFLKLAMNHSHKMRELAIREQELALGRSDEALGQAVDLLTDELNDVRAQLGEMQERLEFTERLLTAGTPPAKDSGGSHAER